jgi:hypothetical protein
MTEVVDIEDVIDSSPMEILGSHRFFALWYLGLP